MSEKISDHVSYLEATKSQTAIRLGIKNEPSLAELEAMQLVADKVFEPLRKAFNKPIFISSFYRSSKLNSSIGGATTSQHTKGEAMDLDIDGSNSKIFHWIKDNLDFDQLIWEFGNDSEPDWVHVSYKRAGNRKEVLKATKKAGKTQYLKLS